MPSTTSQAPRCSCRRSPLGLAIAAAALILVLTFASPADGSAASPRLPQTVTKLRAKAGVPPLITAALRNLANRRTLIIFRMRYKTWSNQRVVRASKQVVKWWIKKKAKECPDPLPKWFFCSSAPKPRWGRGLALGIGGQGPGEFYSQWSPQNPPRVLRPGFVFWLTCWSEGAEINNGVNRSNLWYRLTNGLWVSDGWLYTGTNYPLSGVAHC